MYSHEKLHSSLCVNLHGVVSEAFIYILKLVSQSEIYLIARVVGVWQEHSQNVFTMKKKNVSFKSTNASH